MIVHMKLRLPITNSANSYDVNPSKIIAVGLNYRSHIAESASIRVRGLDGEIPEDPVIFSKTPNVLIAHRQSIVLPLIRPSEDQVQDSRTDYEGELIVIIGRRGKNIPEDAARTHILGYTCGNDVSQRNVQHSDKSGWFRGKSFDTFGPVGPCILPAESAGYPLALQLETRLNGKTVQTANTSEMIFSIPKLISYISYQMTLEDGDLIFTGTPSGVGPLQSGDVVEVEIEGIGVLENPVVDAV